MWAVFSFEYFSGIELGGFGVKPRTMNGLIGILTMPVIHGDLGHIMSNSLPLIILGSTLYLFYDKIAKQVFLQCYFITSALVWIAGRDDFYHIGASGLIYGLGAFLISYGFFKKDIKSILISIVVVIFYGGMVYGLFPTNSRISYEGHLMGAIVGVASAYGLKNKQVGSE